MTEAGEEVTVKVTGPAANPPLARHSDSIAAKTVSSSRS